MATKRVLVGIVMCKLKLKGGVSKHDRVVVGIVGIMIFPFKVLHQLRSLRNFDMVVLILYHFVQFGLGCDL
jgi:hypothetical protein